MRIYFLILTVGLSSLIVCETASAETAAGSNPPTSSTIVAEVDGVKISLADFERRRPAALFQARNTYYESERKAVENYIEDYLLERQAQKESVTVAELLERHVNSKIGKDPSEDALRVYYEGVDTTETFEAVRQKITDHLRQRRIAKARSAYVQSLRSAATVNIVLAPPRAQVSLKDTPVRGKVEAPVTLVEYADYECQYCQAIKPVLDRVLAENKGKIAFAYKDVPLPNHHNAQKAAEATHCAGAQGRYWEYHDLLFARKQLEMPRLKEQAIELKLDAKAFDNCLETGAMAEIVKAHLAEAQALGLQGTPSFFINGRFFSGAMTYEKLSGLVAEEMGASQTPLQSTAKR